METKFFGRDIVKRPACPFCGLIIEEPRMLEIRRPGDLPVGSCSCGAVYACDESGRNVGSAIIEALLFSCNMDWDLAWNLLPEEDYIQKIVELYDFKNHLIIPGGFYEGRRIAGVLLFIRVHDDVLEVTEEGIRKNLERVKRKTQKPEAKAEKRDGKVSLSKKEIESLVEQYRLESIEDAAAHDRKNLRHGKRLLYSGDELLRKRAAEAMGIASAVIAENDPEPVSRLLDSLFYAITDTAAFTWGAFEAIGEIISHEPVLFAGYAPRLLQFLGDASRRSQTLQALGRIASAKPDLLRRYTYHFFAFLDDPDPRVRGLTALLMGHLGAHEAIKDLERLKKETHPMPIYSKGGLETTTVGRAALEALEKLCA